MRAKPRRYYTLLSLNEITELDSAVRSAPEKRTAQRALAAEVTTRVHGEESTRVAREVSALLFDKADPHSLSAHALAALRTEIPFADCGGAAGHGAKDGTQDGVSDTSVDVLGCLTSLGMAASRGAARRVVDQGGVSVNGARLASGEHRVERERLLQGGYLLLRKGQREFGLVRVS